ncbi:MAG: arginine repressor, partial [Ignavibacteria bacterium]
MENKNNRHFVIKEILNKDAIPNQEKLRIELKKRGFKVTQATLSRDLKELGVSRFTSSNGSKYVPQKNETVKALSGFIAGEIVSIKSNESAIVIATLPGCANVIGEYIDVQRNPEIIGTI